MSLKPTLLAGLKREPQTNTKTRWYVLSRLKVVTANSLEQESAGWGNKIEFNSEADAFKDFIWLSNHTFAREYILVRTTPKEEEDPLDDPLPWIA